MYRVIACGIAVVASAFMALYVYQQNQREPPQQYRNRRRTKHSKSQKRIEEVKKTILDRTLECPICYERCKFSQDVWFCPECVSPVHITKCLKPWIIKEGKSECPWCRDVVKLPLKFTCMCGRVENPKMDLYNPFSCGSSCQRCGEDCHPGSCE